MTRLQLLARVLASLASLLGQEVWGKHVSDLMWNARAVGIL